MNPDQTDLGPYCYQYRLTKYISKRVGRDLTGDQRVASWRLAGATLCP